MQISLYRNDAQGPFRRRRQQVDMSSTPSVVAKRTESRREPRISKGRQPRGR